MAWDLFNEPLYFDSLERSKKDVYFITKDWQELADRYAPDHLTTIGLTGIREVFEWDPNLVQVDFLSMHPYEYEPDQVRNEMYWYQKFIDKPWIIGETSVPADNDSVPYGDQTLFARKTLEQAYNCGAVGYSWWQYKDVEWGDFHADFMGVMSRSGETLNSKGIAVTGTPKPVLSVFKEFSASSSVKPCLCPDNYYNYSKGDVYRIAGFLKDEKGQPIEGGVVLGWNENWSSSYHTVSKSDGSFELLGTFPFYHWMASASRYDRVRGDIDPTNGKPGSGNIPTYDLGTLNLKKLKLSRFF